MSYPEACSGFFSTEADSILSDKERTEIFSWAEIYYLEYHKRKFRCFKSLGAYAPYA